MSDRSSIEWTDATWNPVTGCSKISPGCSHCYAETFAERFRGVPGHPYEQGFNLKLWPERVGLPSRWRKPRRIFVNSMSDLFHKDVPDDFIQSVFNSMAATPQHTFQVLTKRSDRALEWTRSRYCPVGKMASLKLRWPSHVWLGVSVEDDNHKERIGHLQNTPATVRFLSIEPLIGPLYLDAHFLTGIHWVIVGGESGPYARPMNVEWVTHIQERCEEKGVAFFFKQWGTYDAHGRRVGKKRAGRLLMGRMWDQFPVPGDGL